MTTDILRIALLIFMAAMLALGLDFLRRRCMPWEQTALWGLLMLFIPALGPFLVIAIQPGRPRRGRPRRNLRQISNV